jgi:predicted ester cyclase
MQRRPFPMSLALIPLALLTWSGFPLSAAYATEDLSGEASKVRVRRVYELVFEHSNLAVIDMLFTPNFVAHGIGGAEGTRGTRALKHLVGEIRAAFPDLSLTIEDQKAEGEMVVTRYTVRGTQLGRRGNRAPTGKQMTARVLTVDRIEGGKIAESWINVYEGDVIPQLGTTPAPARSKQ